MSKPKLSRVIRIYGSEILHSVAYDPHQEVLDVKLHGAKQLYRYRGVSAYDFADLVCSKSAGKVYAQRIKTKSSGYGLRIARKALKLRRTTL